MGKSKKITYYDYHISWLHSFCHGPVDELKQIWFNEKELMAEDDALLANGRRSVDKPDLFGDYEREGGVVGEFHWMAGGDTQIIPDALAKRVGFDKNNYPGFRGLGNIFFCGESDADNAGMKIASNNPRIPTVWARLFRASRGMAGNNSVIVGGDGYRNSNPAHMIVEVLTNKTWGMGGTSAMLDMPSFIDGAATLFDEDFGLSMLWTKQSTAEAFIQEICDHVQAMVYFDPFTGLIVFKLIRNDYDKNTLPEVGPDTANLIQFRRPLWGETVNEITVSWTRPKTEQEETITFQDLGNIAMQGEVVSENRNYYAIRSKALAKRVGERDIVSAASPLVTAQLKTNRREWKYLPGQCIRFTWPDHGIVRLVMRVMHIDWGRPDNAEITVDLMEDVFAFEYAEFGPPQEETWTDPKQDPNSEAVEDLPTKFIAPPYSIVQIFAAENDVAADLLDDRYPEIVIGALVSPLPRTAGNPGQGDVQSFIMNVPDVLPNGDPTWTPAGEKTLTGRAEMTIALAEEVTSEIEFENRYGGPGPEVGGMIVIGAHDTNEWTEEWVLVTSRISGTRWRVQRGALDTIPREWPSGSLLWFIGAEADVYDPSPRIAGAAELYKLQPRTTAGVRKLALTPTKTTTRPDRLYRPYRPANCKIENVMFGTEDQSQRKPGSQGFGDDYYHVPRDIEVDVSWSNRNRTMEDTIFRRWDDANVAPEFGQTTEIIVFSGLDYEPPAGEINLADPRIVAHRTGLTGSSAKINLFLDTQQYTQLTVMFLSRRDGRQSLQGITINLWLYFKGFGFDWGWAYGGWPDAEVLQSVDGAAYGSSNTLQLIESEGQITVESPIIVKERTWSGYADDRPPDAYHSSSWWPRADLGKLKQRFSAPGQPADPFDSVIDVGEE